MSEPLGPKRSPMKSSPARIGLCPNGVCEARALRAQLEHAADPEIERIIDLEAELKHFRAENAEYDRAHNLMVAQFKTMQKEKEHGWREAERWEDKAERLRAELARRDEQIAAVRALHVQEIDRGDPTGYCCDCEQRFPCNTAIALRGGAS